MPNFEAMTASEMNDWYLRTVGYRPQEDDPTMTNAELLVLCISYAEAVAEESA